jgi:DNA-binding response OmpR family regulator
MRVLVVEDEQDLAEAIATGLRREGYAVDLAHAGDEALVKARVYPYDLICLDLSLPGAGGREVCRTLRAEVRPDGAPQPRILMLTARGGVDDRIAGLDDGADDYLVKPFERDELLARMRALLRRRPPRGSAYMVVGDLRLNPDSREVLRGERELELTAREFELLEHLMRNERIVVSRQALLDEVWGYHPFAETNTVDVFISNLRRKLEAGGEERLLHTVRGAGYVLRDGD